MESVQLELVRTDIEPFDCVIAVAKDDSEDEWVALCPFHKETKPSCSINKKKGVFYCHGCGAKGYVLGFVKDETQIEATYNYTDESNTLLFQVVKFKGKHFVQRRLDETGSHWIWSTKGVRKVIYKLPEVLNSPDPIIIVEGEKDVERLIELGFNATTSSGGAGKWRDEYSEFFKERCVVVVPDNDEPGQEHTKAITESLSGSVRVLNLPNLEHKEDISDWFNKKGTAEELKKLIRQTESTKRQIKAVLYAIPIKDYLIDASEEIEWLVSELIPKGAITLLCALPKAGKSILSLNLALELAKSSSFLGYKGIKARSLIIQLEDPDSLIKTRLLKMGADQIEEGVWFKTGLVLDDKAWDGLPVFIKENNIDLVIIDPLVYATGGADENDAAKMAKFFLPLRQICAETGAAFLIIHHLRKSPGEEPGTQIRGSTAIFGAIDTALILRRITGEGDEIDESYLTATMETISRMSKPAVEILALDDESLIWESKGAQRQWRKDQQKTKIFKMIEEEDEIELKELKERCEMSSNILTKYLKELVDEKHVEMFEKAHEGRTLKCYRKSTGLNLPW